MRLGGGLLGALALLLVQSVARADDSQEKAQARQLLSQGNVLFEKGDLKGALTDFRAAYALFPSPKLLVNAAAAERELGDLAGAANDLRRFLDEDSEDDPFLTDRARTELKALERRLGRVSLAGWPPRTTIEVDGRTLRDPAYVSPGARRLRVRSPSGASLEHVVEIGAGESTELRMPAAFAVAAEAPAAPKRRWWIGAVVGAAIVVAGGAAAAVIFAGSPTPSPLRGDLGTFKFSDFK